MSHPETSNKQLMKKLPFITTNILISLAMGFIAFWFYISYPATGYLPVESGRWETLASRLSDPDMPPHKAVQLKKHLTDRKLSLLVQLKIISNKLAYIITQTLSPQGRGQGEGGGDPRISSIFWMSFVAVSLTYTMSVLGVKLYLAILFSGLWIVLPGIWKLAACGRPDSWVMGIYALAIAVICYKPLESARMYRLNRILSAVLVGILICLGIEGWIVFLAFILSFLFSNIGKLADRDKIGELIFILCLPLVCAVIIQYLLYYPIAAVSAPFYEYLLKPFHEIFYGNWGAKVVLERLGQVISAKKTTINSSNVILGSLAGSIILVFVLICLSYKPKNIFLPILAVLGLLVIVGMNRYIACGWPVILFPVFLISALIANQLSHSWRVNIVTVFYLIFSPFLCTSIIKKERRVNWERYAPLRQLTERWKGVIAKPAFTGLYLADPLMQAIGFIKSQLELPPEAWLLVDAPYLYHTSRQMNINSAIINHIGFSYRQLNARYQLSKLAYYLYQSKLNAKKMAGFSKQKAPIFLLTDDYTLAKMQAGRLGFNMDLQLKIGFGDFEVYLLKKKED